MSSYQKEDWQVGSQQFFFWYDTDYRIVHHISLGYYLPKGKPLSAYISGETLGQVIGILLV